MGHFALTGAACHTNMGGSTVSDDLFEKNIEMHIHIQEIFIVYAGS